MKLIKLIILLFIITQAAFAKGDKVNEIEGWFIKTADLSATHSFKQYAPSHTYLKDYIGSKWTKNTSENNSKIAKNILNISACFKVDPLLVASIIQKESIFHITAKSHTGALGLMQMTTIAFTEVRDQLGYRGTKYARSSVIEAFKTMVADCPTLTMSEMTKVFKSSRSARNYTLRNDVKLNIAFGVITLKVLLTQSYGKYNRYSNDFVTKIAVQNYNGDTHKVSYAKKVIQYRAAHIKKHY